MPSRHHFPFSEEQMSELASLSVKASNPRLQQRAQALIDLAQGNPLNEVANRHHIRPRTLRAWYRHYQQQGIDGLRDQPRSGRPTKVTEHYRQCLETALTNLSEYPRNGWTVETLRTHLYHQTGILLSATRLCALLHRLGYIRRKTTLVKPDSWPEQPVTVAALLTWSAHGIVFTGKTWTHPKKS